MDRNIFMQIACITDHLYLSSASAVTTDKVRALGITNIINVTLEIPNLQIPNLECTQIHVEDSPSARLSVYFDKCSDKIQQVRLGGGKLLVHCVAGVSRSASLCIAYLMKYKHLNLAQAYNHVKRRRSVIHPNVGFWRQLIEYERTLFGKSSVKMVQSGIGWIPDVYQEETRGMIWPSSSAGAGYNHRY